VTVAAAPRIRVVASVFGTLKLMQMYGRRHGATLKALEGLAEALRNVAGDESEVTLGVRGQRIQVDEQTLRAAECGHLAASFLVEEFRRRGISRIRFSSEVTAADLDGFANAFLEIDLNLPDPAARLTAACYAAGARGVVIEAAATLDESVVLEERRESAMRTYLSGLRAFREVLRADGLADTGKVRRARRAVQDLVERFLEDETAVLALAQIRSFDVRLFNHSLNVCVYALALGQRLSFSRRQLGELGLAALFHDIGKTAAPAAENRLHPVRGALMLLGTGSAQEGILKAAIAAYEHHAQYDLAGYPEVPHETHVLSRIVAIADCFEALTSARSGGAAVAPDEAFSLMRSRAGTLFDPLLLKVFINALGIYPAGTLVELTSGEIAIVTGAPQEAPPDRPRVRVLRTAGGVAPPETAIDLGARDEAGAFLRAIRRSVPPHEVFGSVSEFVASI